MDQKALFKLTYGLFLLSAQENGQDNGCIINTVTQVANDPVRIAISVSQSNYTHDMILRTGRFTVSSITTEADFSLFQHFGMQSGRDVDKFADFPHKARGKNGLYHLTRCANMTMSATVVQSIDLGSHTLFLAEVTDAQVLSDAPSCSYEYYHANIKPKPETSKKKGWVCTVCGYIYEGDPLPEDFICPLCKHGAEDFVPL